MHLSTGSHFILYQSTPPRIYCVLLFDQMWLSAPSFQCPHTYHHTVYVIKEKSILFLLLKPILKYDFIILTFSQNNILAFSRNRILTFFSKQIFYFNLKISILKMINHIFFLCGPKTPSQSPNTGRVESVARSSNGHSGHVPRD